MDVFSAFVFGGVIVGSIVGVCVNERRSRREAGKLNFKIELLEKLRRFRLKCVIIDPEQTVKEEYNGVTYVTRQPVIAVVNGQRYKVGDRLGSTELYVENMSQEWDSDVEGKYVVTVSTRGYPQYGPIWFTFRTSKAKRLRGTTGMSD